MRQFSRRRRRRPQRLWFPVFLGNAPWPVHFPSGRLAIFAAVFDELTASAAEYFFAANPTVAAAVVAGAVLFLRHIMTFRVAKCRSKTTRGEVTFLEQRLLFEL